MDVAGRLRLALLAAALGAAVAACGHAAPAPNAVATMRPHVSAAPQVCFAAHGCPGIDAAICFAANGSREKSARCPSLRRQFRFAEPPHRRR
jgi:hypothetical protein